jgi:putative membrane protein
MNRMIRARNALAVGTLIVFGCGAAAFAGQQTKGVSPYSGDSIFAKKAAQGNLAEVKLAKLAEEKSHNATVDKFAQRMIHDHTKANDQLKAFASKESLAIPTTPSPKQHLNYQTLSKLSGNAFNTAYARNQVSDHQEDIALFEKEANNGKNPELKAYAQKTLPILKEHLRLARQMKQAVEGSPANGGQ